MNYCFTHWFREGLNEKAKTEGKEGWAVPWVKCLEPKLKALTWGLFKAMFRECEVSGMCGLCLELEVQWKPDAGTSHLTFRGCWSFGASTSVWVGFILWRLHRWAEEGRDLGPSWPSWLLNSPPRRLSSLFIHEGDCRKSYKKGILFLESRWNLAPHSLWMWRNQELKMDLWFLSSNQSCWHLHTSGA